MNKNFFKYFLFIIFFVSFSAQSSSYYLDENNKDIENTAKILQLKYITNEIKTSISEPVLSMMNESEVKKLYLEYFVKYPIEEFVKWKEELINLANEKMKQNNDLFATNIIQNKYENIEKEYNKLNLEDKYFVSNYIRHKMLSLYPYEKKDIIINAYIDELSKDYYKKWIDLNSLSNDEFSKILYEKMRDWWDISYMAIFCDYASFPYNIYKINYSPSSYTRASSSRPIKNSSFEVPCDTEFSYYNSNFAFPNIKIYPATSNAIDLVNSYWWKLSWRWWYGNIHLIIWSKRYLYWFFSDTSIMDSIFTSSN